MMRTRKKMRQLTLIKKMKKTLIRRKMTKKMSIKKTTRKKTSIKKRMMQKKLIRNQKVKRKMISTIERPHQRRKKMTNPRIKSSALIPKQKLLPKKSLR